MERKEMTLGEEIINLAKEGVDIPTVERRYKKYLRSQGIVTNASYGINPTVATATGYTDYLKAALNSIYGVTSAFCKKYVDTDVEIHSQAKMMIMLQRNYFMLVVLLE